MYKTSDKQKLAEKQIQTNRENIKIKSKKQEKGEYINSSPNPPKITKQTKKTLLITDRLLVQLLLCIIFNDTEIFKAKTSTTLFCYIVKYIIHLQYFVMIMHIPPDVVSLKRRMTLWKNVSKLTISSRNPSRLMLPKSVIPNMA